MKSRENNKYDELFMKILCEEQSIPHFLNIVFGFLYRRTDLFVEQVGPNQKFGYPTGQCERLIYDCMKHFFWKAKQRNQFGEEMHVFDQVVENEVEIDSTEPVSNTISQLNDLSTQEQTNKTDIGSSKKSESQNTSSSPPADLPFHTLSEESGDKSKEGNISEDIAQNAQSSFTENPHQFIKRAVTSSLSSSSFNGADRGLYAWSQTINEIEVEVRVGASVLKSSQVFVRVTGSNIIVKIDDNETLEETLAHNVKQDESVWTLIPGKCIQIHLEKSKERWWDQLVQSEPKIDLRHIEATRPFSELPEEEQMKVNELIWNDYQKSQGLPTSEQIKTASLLKKAWDMEGSPFKGRPFDPSTINNQ